MPIWEWSIAENALQPAEPAPKRLCRFIKLLRSRIREQRDQNLRFVQQDECAVISRAASELISLGSGYSKEISRLSALICDSAAKEFEKHAKRGTEHSSKYAMVAKEANRDLEKQDNKTKESKPNEVNKKKKKHSSALLAASMYRSPVSAVSSNAYFSGGVDNTSINTEFREQGGIG